MPRMLHWMATVCVMGACATSAVRASAQDDAKQQCVSAYEESQLLSREGSLLEAKSKLEFCASSTCPEVMHGDCERWLDEVEASIPTVVFRVRTPSGQASERVFLSMDGADSVLLDGRALSVNPGQHAFTFSTPGGLEQSKVLLFAEGEKLRRELIVLEASPARHPAPGSTPGDSFAGRSGSDGFSLTLPVALAGSAAIAGAAGFTYFGLTARSGDRGLGGCTPNCSLARVDAVKSDYLLANVSLGIGAAGLVTAILFAVLDQPGSDMKPSARTWLASPPAARGLSVAGSF